MLPCLGVLIAVWLSAASALGEEPLVFIQAGELPIILSAPHGGQLAIPNVEEREQKGRRTAGEAL